MFVLVLYCLHQSVILEGHIVTVKCYYAETEKLAAMQMYLMNVCWNRHNNVWQLELAIRSKVIHCLTWY